MASTSKGEMRMQVRVRFCGFGGQGIVLLGEVLGHAAILGGRWAAQSAAYGAEARGSASTSEVVISEGWIAYPKVEEADILVAMSQEGYERYLPWTSPEGLVLFDTGLVSPSPREGRRHWPVPAHRLAREELGNPLVANMVMLGALVGLTGVVTPEEARAALKARVAAHFLELDLRAFELGFRLAKEEARR